MNFDLIIVDDDPDYIFFHVLLAKKSGLSEDPITFEDGQELIEYVSENNNENLRNTLILLDLYMLRVDGWEVLDYLEKLNLPNKIKVIVISSSVNMNDKTKSISYSSVIDYIEKPLLLNYLENIKDQSIF
ncbi:response regulator [Algoriphagus lacus]|uniref:Response regulator n=1 Tax=Algoriphagus lacus TaxID=2056311 RepID=A0A418PRE9_9BACT|nr:response regulator [Algoriphagus lacus]RIW15143.1 response regulator [Algoriphagus lacus]